MRCPRRDEIGQQHGTENPDLWRSDHTCSYCGSVDPDLLIKWLHAGMVTLTPTDKNYKVYVDAVGGPSHGKFYFQHFNTEQKKAFVEMLNKKQIGINTPGYFYVLPYFCSRGPTNA